MHLWPTKNLRDSFKDSYLKRLEWNYQRMKAEKNQQQSSTEQKLLENENQDHGNNNNGDAPNLLNCEAGSVSSLFQELLLVLSCCYCCFCCGGGGSLFCFNWVHGLLVKSVVFLWEFLSGVG
ncbi:hypothetical protein GLYMA_02G073500v4 [Glycine max]|uniref:Uncharacterized protein n=1 Tax=Glycine soja TaxID=3848 RepID=A0A445LKW3_GLYSO|nr:uncharacterized protein LOC114383674 [Glycine soja]KAG4401835.1 hypothetical protein GLYMA_02G073500v4 [Glycine max]KAH1059183.1 hypothetical protein GYH30_003298 [Glycine max]RZC23815.1 hypothetical protein D0Y65_003234 [Glycine soja]